MSPLSRSVLLVAAAGLVAGAALAQTERRARGASGGSSGAVDTNHAPVFTHRGPGAGFVQASRTTRTDVVGQVDPFFLSMPALPPGAIEVKSVAAWHFLDDGAPLNDTIQLNGVAVAGTWQADSSPGLCSAKSWIDLISADVTGLVNLGGPNLLNDVCDKAYGGDPNALGGGITLITVYEFALGPDREVDVFRFLENTEAAASGDVSMTFGLTTPYVFDDVQFFINALGGSSGDTDGFRINGSVAAGVLAGTGAAGDAWLGLLGPNPDDNRYDAAEGDIQSFLAGGDPSFVAETFTGTDCIAHSLAAVSHQVECGDVVLYCTSKVNSLGCAPFVDTTGTPSESSGLPFRIRGFDFRNNKNGLLFYGYAPLAASFQGGHLCVKAPIVRTPVQNSGGNVGTQDCSGTYVYDFNALIRLGTDAKLVPGAFVFAQYWSRDPDDAFTTSMSNAVAFDICP